MWKQESMLRVGSATVRSDKWIPAVGRRYVAKSASAHSEKWPLWWYTVMLKLLRSDSTAGSHIHFPGLLVEGAQRGDVPAARCQEARGDGRDCRLHNRQKKSWTGIRSWQVYGIKVDIKKKIHLDEELCFKMEPLRWIACLTKTNFVNNQKGKTSAKY